ncbi:MAG: alpha/beta fold hydrolase [Candidatus Neomarinimicrobiota bacterium]|nr:MAG: alpha/beta fold hydrolase [Candidatus Neomarinimicrobiota bacterium]
MTIRRFILFLLVFPAVIARAQAPQQWISLGDFPLESGAQILNARQGYRRYGSADLTARPVVVVPTWFGGHSADLAALTGPDNLLDTTRFTFLVLDALGNGVSSSPSTSSDQPAAAFPRFTIGDMVRAQYQALTRGLQLHHVYAILGGSMGGMQVFQWVVDYPGFMDKAVSYVGVPWLSAHSRLVLEAELAAIRAGQEAALPDSIIANEVALIQVLNAYTPAYRNRRTRRDSVPDFIRAYEQRFRQRFRLWDWTRQVQAMLVHDVTRPYGHDLEATLSRVRAPCLIIVSRQDHLVTPEPAREWARSAGATLVEFDNDCGHLAPGCEKERFVRVVNQFLRQ